MTFRCPECGGKEYRPGPMGGASINVECRKCKSRFNVIFGDNERIDYCEPIERESEGGGHWPDFIFIKGESVLINHNATRSPGKVLMASSNGFSLLVAFDGIIANHAGMLPLLYDGTGTYRSIIDTSVCIKLERMQ